jgi:hypothetical protein
VIKVFTIPEFDKSLKRLSRKFPSLKIEFPDLLKELKMTMFRVFLWVMVFTKPEYQFNLKERGKVVD